MVPWSNKYDSILKSKKTLGSVSIFLNEMSVEIARKIVAKIANPSRIFILSQVIDEIPYGVFPIMRKESPFHFEDRFAKRLVVSYWKLCQYRKDPHLEVVVGLF